MQSRNGATFGLAILSLLTLLAFVALADTPANVAGTWNITVSGTVGRANQTIDLKQNGNNITGTFEGPRQSGPLEGTIDGSNIKFRVSARVPLDYTGTVSGDSMKGTTSGRGKTGDWTATRAK